MNFKKGDKVKFLNENDYGTITRVMDNGIVMVLNSDDFEVPVKTSELIPDPNNTDTKEVTVDDRQAKVQVKIDAKKQEKVQKTHKIEVAAPKTVNFSAPQVDKDEYGIYLGFVPSNDSKALDKCDLDLYFINDSNYRICYNFMRPNKENTLFQTVAGILEPDSKELFEESFKRDDLNNLSYFKFQFLYSKDGFHSVKSPEEIDVRINPVKFYQPNYYKVNDFFEENAIIIPVKQNSEMLEAAQKLSPSDLFKDKIYSQPKKQKTNVSDKVIVDLHLTELIDDERGMSPKEKLDYQLKVFKEKMEEFIKNPHIKKAIFIHGKGNGTLKMEIKKSLDHEYKRYSYQDASFEEYGGGATLVILK